MGFACHLEMASLAVMWVVLCWLSISPVAGAVSGALSKYLFIKCQHQIYL